MTISEDENDRNEHSAANRQELDSYSEQLRNVAADYEVGDVQMLILAAADKLGMASDLLEAETDA